jgi:methionyl aminopeptidase
VILLKSATELELMHQANVLVHETLRLVAEAARPGVTTAELDALAEEHIRSRGGLPAFKGYRGYPATLCTSVNDVIVHGIPSADCVLNEGDIASVDCGVVWHGYFGDAAVSVAVGSVAVDARRLLEVTRECLEAAVGAMRPGGRVSDVGSAIQRHAERNGFVCEVRLSRHSGAPRGAPGLQLRAARPRSGAAPRAGARDRADGQPGSGGRRGRLRRLDSPHGRR